MATTSSPIVTLRSTTKIGLNLKARPNMDNFGHFGSITNQFGEKSGGDIITAVDGKSIIKLEDLISYLETQKFVGDNITLTIYDTEVNDIIDKEATLRERPAPAPSP